MAFQQQIFEQPDQRGQALIIAISRRIELRKRDANDSLRPGCFKEAQEEQRAEEQRGGGLRS